MSTSYVLTVGDLITAGDVARAIRYWEQAGRGATGWAEARRLLQELRPTAYRQALNALVRRAESIVRSGQSYRQAGPNYVPQPWQVQDLTRSQPPPQRPAGTPPPPPRQAHYFYEALIEMNDPLRPDLAPQRFTRTVPSDALLSRAQLDTLLAGEAADFHDTFLSYEKGGRSRSRLQYTVRIEGVWRGF